MFSSDDFSCEIHVQLGAIYGNRLGFGADAPEGQGIGVGPPPIARTRKVLRAAVDSE